MCLIDKLLLQGLVGDIFSKMLSIVAFYSKYTRARIFENMCLIDKLLLQRLVGVVALYVCLICMPSMCAYVCLICMPD